MRKVYKARISETARLAEDAEAFCAAEGVGADAAFAMNLCLDEVFTNIVEYGYRGAEGEIEVELACGGGSLRAVVRDSAPPFNPLTEAKAPDLDAALEDRQIGGLGIYFVKKQMDEVEYAYANGRNELRLSKRLPC